MAQQRELALKIYFPDRDGPDPDPVGTKRKAAIAAADAAREKKAKAAAALDAKRQKALAARAAQADSKASKLREAEKRRAENVALAEAKQAAALTARSASMVTMRLGACATSSCSTAYRRRTQEPEMLAVSLCLRS